MQKGTSLGTGQAAHTACYSVAIIVSSQLSICKEIDKHPGHIILVHWATLLSYIWHVGKNEHESENS